jgi:DNA mismatch repair protein MutS2
LCRGSAKRGPGESSALDTAERLGISSDIIQRARALRGESSFDFAQAVSRLEQARKKVESAQSKLEKETQSAREEWARAESKKKEFQTKLQNQITQEAREQLKELQALKKELSDAVKNASKDEIQSGAQKLFTQIADAGDKLRLHVNNPGAAESHPLTPEDNHLLQAGNVLEIQGLGLGKILESIDDKKMTPNTLILVQVGELKTRVSLSRIRKPAQSQIDHHKQVAEAQAAARQRQSSKISLHSSRNEGPAKGSSICDVRGKNTEEAMAKVETSLNELLNNDAMSVTIIHGHGSDKLKDSIRNYLTLERTDLRFRPGTWPGEAGDGLLYRRPIQ